MIIHVYFSASKLAVSLGSSLNPQPGGLGFKQLPRATANVNARKSMYDPYILLPLFDYLLFLNQRKTEKKS